MSEQGSTATRTRTEPDGEGGVRYYYTCGACAGTGTIGEDECPDCGGSGEWFE